MCNNYLNLQKEEYLFLETYFRFVLENESIIFNFYILNFYILKIWEKCIFLIAYYIYVHNLIRTKII